MPIDKRQFSRVNIPCKISTVFGERLLVFSSHTENLGIGGIMTILEARLRISTVVALELLLTNRESPLKCAGEVMWVREMNPKDISPRLFYTGIQFTDISDSDQEEIRKFVHPLLPGGHAGA